MFLLVAVCCDTAQAKVVGERESLIIVRKGVVSFSLVYFFVILLLRLLSFCVVQFDDLRIIDLCGTV